MFHSMCFGCEFLERLSHGHEVAGVSKVRVVASPPHMCEYPQGRQPVGFVLIWGWDLKGWAQARLTIVESLPGMRPSGPRTEETCVSNSGSSNPLVQQPFTGSASAPGLCLLMLPIADLSELSPEPSPKSLAWHLMQMIRNLKGRA